MQVYKCFLKIMKKNILPCIIYFSIFLVLILMMTSNGNSAVTNAFSSEKVDLAVIDRDNSTLSKGVKEYLGSLHNLVDLEDNKDKLQDSLYYREVSYILILPKGFEDNIINGTLSDIVENVKVPNSYAGTFIDSQVDQYIKTLAANLTYQPSKEEAVKASSQTAAISTDVTMLDHKTESANRPFTYYFKYLPYVLICIVLIGLGPILMVFHSKDIKARMESSAISLRYTNIQLILGCFSFLVIYWGLFVIVAFLLYGRNLLTTEGLLTLLNTFVFALVCLSITFFISMLINSVDALNMIGNTLGLGMSFLTGIFIPQEYLGKSVLAFAKLLPSYWYINASDILSNYNQTGSELKTVFVDIGIELLFAVAIMAIALVVSKYKRNIGR